MFFKKRGKIISFDCLASVCVLVVTFNLIRIEIVCLIEKMEKT